jgi:hypothetical protein
MRVRMRGEGYIGPTRSDPQNPRITADCFGKCQYINCIYTRSFEKHITMSSAANSAKDRTHDKPDQSLVLPNGVSRNRIPTGRGEVISSDSETEPASTPVSNPKKRKSTKKHTPGGISTHEWPTKIKVTHASKPAKDSSPSTRQRQFTHQSSPQVKRCA